jgi:hypothetical protein
MIGTIARYLRPVLEFAPIRRTRRNHALEHATVHMLAARRKGLRIAGRSSNGGYVLIGNIPLEDVQQAAQEALERMQNGEARLAVHPNCGTNLVTAGVLTTLAGWVGLGGKDTKATPDRLSFTSTLMILAIFISQPLGMSLQKHITTKGDPGDLEIVDISRREVKLPWAKNPFVMHTVTTRRG